MKILKAMLGKLKLATKFTLLLSLVFLIGILMSGFALSKGLEYRAEAELNYRAEILMQMMNSLRGYANSCVNPLLNSLVETQQNFTPESLPSYSTREFLENFRKNEKFTNYLYKDATVNPTNVRDKADEFETKIVEHFRSEPELKIISGFRTMLGEELFYTARPFAITDQKCLRCHSTPEKAPKSHLATYGTTNGFGWNFNEIVATQIVYVPKSQFHNTAFNNFYLVIGIFIGIFIIIILLINFLLKWNVILPLKPLALVAEKMSADTIRGDEAKEFELKSLVVISKRADEIGQLGRVFQRMVREIYAREQHLKQQVQELSIEIDQAKKSNQVAEIEEMDYFQDLHKQAKEIRNKWQNSSNE
ncbi:c-type heme family protein [Scytonema hofmannii]|nr:DUF3365 domain-containing protein [Scytonema hofmannii]